MEVWRKFISYITFRKQHDDTTEASSSLNLKAMHTINKISILMFLVGLVILAVKLFG
jgi:hypothetical protein